MKRAGIGLSFALSGLLLGGCAHAPASVVAPQVQLRQPLPGLYTAGQPAPGDWAAIRARGVRTVINLRTPNELEGRNEAAEVQASGMRYIEIPVAGSEGVNAANARLLHEALSPAHGGGVLVHCASANRAGALLALEQKDYDGASADAALALGKQAGVTKLEGVLKQALGIH